MTFIWKTICLTVVVLISTSVDAVMNGMGYEMTAGPIGQHHVRPMKRQEETVRWMAPQSNRPHRSGNPSVQRIRTGPSGPPIQVKRVYVPMKYNHQGNMPPPRSRQPPIYRYGPPHPPSMPKRSSYQGKPYWKPKRMIPSPSQSGHMNNFIPQPQRKRVAVHKPVKYHQKYPTKYLSKPLSYKIEPQTKPLSASIGQEQIITDSYGAPQQFYKVPSTTYGIPHPTQGSPEPPIKENSVSMPSSYVTVYQNSDRELEAKTSYSFANHHPSSPSSSSSLVYSTNNHDLWNHSPVYKHNGTNSSTSSTTTSTTTSTTETPSVVYYQRKTNGFQPPKQTFGFTPYADMKQELPANYYTSSSSQQQQQQDYLSPNYFDQIQ